MKDFTVSEAQQDLADLLEQVGRDGVVRIRRNDGRTFLVTPEQKVASPLDVPGIDLNLTKEEIIDFIREGRDRGQAR